MFAKTSIRPRDGEYVKIFLRAAPPNNGGGQERFSRQRLICAHVFC